MNLTRRRLAVLQAVDSLREQAGYPPTVREVGKAVGLSSTASVVSHLWTLKQEGLVKWKPRTPRTLVLTEAGVSRLKEVGAA